VDRGVVLSAPATVALEEIELDPPGAGEVLVRIEATGVCHTDLHVIEQDGWGHPLPVLLGHEGAGIVEAVGEGVDTVAPGDRVVIGWKTACGECVYCKRGEPRQCKRPPSAGPRLHRADGTVLTPVLRSGTFVTRTVVPAVAAVRVPGELPVE
jgi:S-(hydroxymethyl)mycothiol dehydrogenase